MNSNYSNIKIDNYASREQLESIFDILGKVFSVGRAFFQERVDNDPTYDPTHTWFATVDDVIASSVQIFPMPLRVGNTVLKVAGLGSVCTDENYQGRGLASRILNAQTEWLKQQNYPLSMLLASRHSFYSRSGWKLLPEPMLKLNNAAYASSNAANASTITAFAPEHLTEMSRLYNAFNATRTGSYDRDETYWNSLVKWPTWREAECLLLWSHGKLIAYGIIAHTQNEQATLREFIYDPLEKQDVMPLFNALCQLRSDAKHILAKLPSDHLLYNHFLQLGATSFELDVAMWKIVNCRALFAELHNEFSARLQASQALSEIGFQLQIQTEHDRICFHYISGQLKITVATEELSDKTTDQAASEKEHTVVNISELELIKWLLYGFEDEQHVIAGGEKEAGLGADIAFKTEADYANELKPILQTLFPPQRYAFYITDYY